MLLSSSVVGSRKTLPAPFVFAFLIKDPAEAQKVNMGTIKSTWALDVLGVGLKMQRAVPKRAHDVRLPLRRKIVEMWTPLHCITVVTITRQCHEAAASKRASRRSAQFKLKMRSCEEVRNVQTVQRFFAAFAFSRALVPPESPSSPTISKSAPWCDWRLDRI